MKYSKEIVLSIGPYKTMRIAVTEASSFEECDKELKNELAKHPEVADMNKEEIEKILN
ncbi:MAG: hypothetical protein ACOC80_16540 [Petrotogales bacterium]